MTPLNPLLESERIESLDVLRGFALLGILVVNIGAFSMPAAAYFDPTAYGDLNGVNRWIWQLTHVLADLKFMAIFSMLFGAGIVLMSERSAAKGISITGIHYRRMVWLVIFGLLHAHLLWYADILYWYGLCGMVVYLFRKMPPTRLIVLGLLSITLTSALMFATGATTDQWPPGMLKFIVNDLKPSPEAIAEEVASYQGSWLDQMEERVPKALEMQTNTFLVWAAWRVGGLMLLGMGLYKMGVLTARRSAKFYWSLVGLGLLVGVPVAVFGIQHNFANDWRAPDFFFLGLQFNYWARLCQKSGVVRLIREMRNCDFPPSLKPRMVQWLAIFSRTNNGI